MVVAHQGTGSSDHLKLRRKLLVPVAAGLVVITAFFGIFGTWAMTAPLAGATVANGKISPDTERKTIQHLEGGIVREILVREGSIVSAGTPLVRLYETHARAELQQQLVELRTRRVRITRFLAERRVLIEDADVQDVPFPQDLLEEAKSNPSVKELIDAEKEQYESFRSSLTTQIALYEQTIRQREAEIFAMEAQIRAVQKERAIVSEQIKVYEGLAKQGYGTYSKLRDTQMKEAANLAEEASIRVKVVTAREDIVTTRLKVAELKTTELDKVASDLATARGELQKYQEQVEQSRDTLARTTIRSPVDGTVMNIQVHTLGGVVAPGGVVMDVVPTNDDLIIDAEVMTTDIDNVHVGQKAEVILTAYPTRHLPPISGVVINVSGDALEESDSTEQESYYQAKISVSADEIQKLGRDVTLVPGMPVEVLILNQERTLADYLLEPIVVSIRRSFRES